MLHRYNGMHRAGRRSSWLRFRLDFRRIAGRTRTRLFRREFEHFILLGEGDALFAAAAVRPIRRCVVVKVMRSHRNVADIRTRGFRRLLLHQDDLLLGQFLRYAAAAGHEAGASLRRHGRYAGGRRDGADDRPLRQTADGALHGGLLLLLHTKGARCGRGIEDGVAAVAGRRFAAQPLEDRRGRCRVCRWCGGRCCCWHIRLDGDIERGAAADTARVSGADW